MPAGVAYGIALFAHVVVRTFKDASLRREVARTVMGPLLVTLAISVLLAFVVRRIPMVRLDDDLLPRVVWEKNAATLTLVFAWLVEWAVAGVWPRAGEVRDRLVQHMGVPHEPVRVRPFDEVRHRARTLAPMLVVSVAWTFALLAAANLGLRALASHASDAERLLVTGALAALLVILPALPLVGTWVWFVADRVGRSREPALRARTVLEAHPGEVLGLALCLLPGVLPLTHVLWRPFVPACAALLRATRVDADMPLPDRLRADPLADLLDQLRTGVGLLRGAHAGPPPREGRIVRALWAASLVMVALRKALTDPAVRARTRRVLGAQLVAFVALSALCLWLFGLDLDDKDARVLGGNIKISFGKTVAAALFSLLHITEAIVIALSREHHDAISADAARALGVPPDDDVANPRVRFDGAWAWRRFKRRAQGVAILVASALPWVVLALFVTLPIVKLLEDAVVVGWFLRVFVDAITNAVVLVLGLYWAAVFLVGKTGHAWTQPTDREPFFLEGIARVAAKYPRAAWPLALYLWVVRRTLGAVPRPAALMERMSAEAVGLALVRFTCVIPGVYLVLRPFFPVGATLLLQQRAPECLPALPAHDPIEPASGHAP